MQVTIGLLRPLEVSLPTFERCGDEPGHNLRLPCQRLSASQQNARVGVVAGVRHQQAIDLCPFFASNVGLAEHVRLLCVLWIDEELRDAAGIRHKPHIRERHAPLRYCTQEAPLLTASVTFEMSAIFAKPDSACTIMPRGLF